MNEPQIKALYPKASQTNKTPFEEDIFGRNEIAKQLTLYIDRLYEGAVIAIDAPWGEGKTWFAKEWEKQLKSTYKTIYVDAFKHDYIEDPFVMIAAELNKIFKTEEPELAENAKKISKILLPVTGKIIVGAISKVIGTEIGELLDQEAIQQAFDKKFDEYEENEKSIESFREKLTELAAKQPNPIVVMIDELDRCKPTFSIKMIERIKHFFDVPNVVFVLFVNRIQLESAIKTIYGVDGCTYLGKFVNLWFGLPKEKNIGNGVNFNRAFCNTVLLKRYDLASSNQNIDDFCINLSDLASISDLSLRDLEQAFILYNLQQIEGIKRYYIAWLIVIKIKFPEMFAKILTDDKDNHKELASIAAGLRKKNPELELLSFFEELHLAHSKNFKHDFSEKVQNELANLRIHPKDFIPSLAKTIDLQIS